MEQLGSSITDVMTTVAGMLAEARSRIERVEPTALAEGALQNPLVVDLRCPDERRRTGMIPGSIAIGRSVLEWRADPTSTKPDPEFGDRHRLTVLVCEDGESSSLAADSLRRLGFTRAGDLIGGMSRWLELGLPVVAPTES